MSRTFASFILLLVSTIVILFWQSIGVGLLHIISHFYSVCMNALQVLIQDHLIRQILVIILVSLLLGLLPVFVYWVVNRRWYHGYMAIVWCIWVVLMTMVMVRVGAH